MGAAMGSTTDFRALTGPMENEHVMEWKAAGGRVMGYFCCHAPEELFWAAGMLPIRMRGTGSEETSYADQYLGAVNCSFVRHTLDRVMGGELEILDGILVTNSCDHIRRLSDIFSTKKAVPFCCTLDIPHLRTEQAVARLADQLRSLKVQMESEYGIEITDEKLSEAIKLFNETRRLLGKASALRGENPPRATGSEVLAMSVAAAAIPKDKFNPMLEKRIAELEAGNGLPDSDGPRLMVIGNVLDDPEYLEVIESYGATIVDDQLCCGGKTFSNLADEDGDPLAAIANRILGHTPCPRMLADYEERLGSVLDSVDRNNVDGVVCQRLKFCDLWGGETKMLRTSFKEEGRVPLLFLERDYLTSGTIGQLRTRIQAFLESLA